MNLKLQDYSYHELCTIMEEKKKTGKSKQLQLKNWERFFRWEHPSKQTFRIVEIYETAKEKQDGRKNNGGYRAGAGAPVKMQEEFEYLFRCFLWWLYHINEYSYNHTSNAFYFTNTTMDSFFGLKPDHFSQAYSDNSLEHNILSRIIGKLAEKRKSWILSKISRTKGIELKEGIIAYKNKRKKNYEFKDEWLEEWKTYREEYIKSKGFSSINGVLDNNLWPEMIAYISQRFVGYEEVILCHKIICHDLNLFKEYDLSLYQMYKERVNQRLVAELKTFFAQEKFAIVTNESVSTPYLNAIKKYVQMKYKYKEDELEKYRESGTMFDPQITNPHNTYYYVEEEIA